METGGPYDEGNRVTYVMNGDGRGNVREGEKGEKTCGKAWQYFPQEVHRSGFGFSQKQRRERLRKERCLFLSLSDPIFVITGETPSLYSIYSDAIITRTSFRHSAIPPFRHSAIPPFRHPIPPFRHSAILPFCHSAILFHHQSSTHYNLGV